MEFKDVAEIIRRVNVKVHEIIDLSSLIVYLQEWFSPVTYQPIQRYICNHGEAITAAIKFFDPFKSRPQYFPKLIAVLRLTKQDAVYQIFMTEIRQYYQGRRADELKKVLDLISKEERKLGINDGDDNNGSGGNPIPGAGGSGGSGGVDRSGVVGGSGGVGIRYNENVLRLRPPADGATGSGPAVGRGSDKTQVLNSDRPVSGQGPAACRGSDPTQVMHRIDRSVSGSKISDLRGSVHKQLGEALEETNSDHKPFWELLIEDGDVEISRSEQKALESNGNPGVKFLDLLGERDCTIEELLALFSHFEIERAQQILIDNQNKVVKSQQKAPSTDTNNLNSNYQQKQVPLKMNIPGQNPVPPSPVQIDAPETPQPNIETGTCLSLDNNVELLESVKGTTPVQEFSTGRRHAEWDNTPSAGNLPNNHPSMDPVAETNRNRENTGIDVEPIGNTPVEPNSGEEPSRRTVEPKPPRDEGTPVTGVNAVPASLNLSNIDSLQNNVGSQPAINEVDESTQNNANNDPPHTDCAPPLTDDAPPPTNDVPSGNPGDVTSANASANISQLPTVINSLSSSFSTLSIPDNSNGGNLPNFQDDDNSTSS